MSDATERNNKRLAEAYEEDLKNFSDKQDGKKAKNLAILEESLQLAMEFGQGIFEVSSAYRQRDLENIDRQKAYELELAGNNADARKQIEANYEKKQREIRIRQAKADRAAALYSIALNTAAGVMSVLSTGGGTRYADLGVSAGLLSLFVVAQGLIQAGIIVSKPIPQFKKGTRNAPGGLAVVAEAGPELIVSPKGQASYVEKPSIVPLEKGSQVYTADETMRLMQQMEATRILETSRARARMADDIQRGRAQQTREDFAYALKTSGMDYDRMKGVLAEAFKEHTTQVFIDGQEAQRQRQAQITRMVNQRNSFT